ncbi:MAG TPA: hypothetical protein VLG46_05050 [Anaerolineae bacterium]|nr:hypothetical protein [Anaerolineae bacterium]
MNDILREARTILQTTSLRWISLAQSLSENVLSLPPAPGEWSAGDCL